MGKPDSIHLPGGTVIPILYEDRNVIAIDKPPGWLLAPEHWRETRRNLQLALVESIRAKDFWARSRQVRYLRYIHRLDEDTSGILLLARNAGAVSAYSRLFRNHQVDKRYLAVVSGIPTSREWLCRDRIAPHPTIRGRMRIDNRRGKPSETRFRVLAHGGDRALVEVFPLTGRTHQIRVHLRVAGYPVLGDPWYGLTEEAASSAGLALRAVGLGYRDPFTRRQIRIAAHYSDFCREHGMEISERSESNKD